MRIISGSARGRRLAAPAEGDRSIRPTSDRAREALFSIIGRAVVGARVLDLFAGTGALGCEALSRGASSAVFVENNRGACDLIRTNIALIPEGPRRSTLMRHDLRKGFGPRFQTYAHGHPFDLVFADPPYDKGFSGKILQELDNCPVLSNQVLVIIEEKKDVAFSVDLHNLLLESTRRYGDTVFAFFRLRDDRSTSAIPDPTP